MFTRYVYVLRGNVHTHTHLHTVREAALCVISVYHCLHYVICPLPVMQVFRFLRTCLFAHSAIYLQSCSIRSCEQREAALSAAEVAQSGEGKSMSQQDAAVPCLSWT